MNFGMKLLGVCMSFASAAAPPAFAQGATGTDSDTRGTEVRAPELKASAQGQARIRHRISAQFSDWAGSRDNAAALVNGLRDGRAIALTDGAGGGALFNPPTRPMGYGNVSKSLMLAKAQLASRGITSPTPLEIQTALTGAPPSAEAGLPQVKGVLQLRSEGMGWGQIAHEYGLRPGTVISEGQSVQRTPVSTRLEVGHSRGSPPEGAGAARHSQPHGIVNAAGTGIASYSRSTVRANGVSGGASGKPAAVPGKSIVQASGGSPPGGAQGMAKGHFK